MKINSEISELIINPQGKDAEELLDEAETNYISLIKNNEDTKYKINLYNLYITKKLYQKALDIINSISILFLSANT